MLQKIISHKLKEEEHNIKIIEKELTEEIKSSKADWILQKNAMEQYVDKIEREMR